MNMFSFSAAPMAGPCYKQSWIQENGGAAGDRLGPTGMPGASKASFRQCRTRESRIKDVSS
jgi:hypothetical protein